MTARWIVGIDGSDAAVDALRWAVGHGIGRDVDITALGAFHVPAIMAVFAAKRGGTIVTCAATSGYMVEFDNRHFWMKLKNLIGSHFANYAESYAANKLLDDIGLKRGSDGVRKLSDGRPLEIIVETAGETTEQTDILELIRSTWKDAGIKLFSKPSQRDVLRNRVFSGEAMMSVWFGIDNALATSDTAPDELAPVSQIQLQWPKFGQYHETAGKSGEAPDIPEAIELMKLREAWRTEPRESREKIWHRMLSIHAEQQYSIGVVNGVQQPVVVHNALKNVPEKGLYNWEPGSFFGIYRPDTFWFTDARRN